MRFRASEIKAMVAGYLRYKKQCPVIAFEASNQLKVFNGELADVLAVTKSRMLYEVEAKVSLSDLKHDIRKNKHRSFANAPSYLPVYKFYFAVPQELSNAAIPILADLYPYAGLLIVSKFPFNSAALDFGVREVVSPKLLNRNPLSLKNLLYLIKEQSGTVSRLARDKALAEKNYRDILSKNRKMERSLKLAGVTYD